MVNSGAGWVNLLGEGNHHNEKYDRGRFGGDGGVWHGAG